MPTEPTPIDPIALREAEVAQYDSNIALYQSILATLPTEWPSRLEQYKGRTDHQQAVAEVDDLDDVELLSKLLYADQVKASIRAEKLERTKAAAILAALKA
jgi:hypothetical protein